MTTQPSFGQPGYSPGGPPAVQGKPRAVTQGRVVQPSATSNGMQSAAFGLGQVLKAVVAGVPQAFRTENDLLAAHNAIDKFITASVPASAMPALADGTQMAPIEDVAKRVPPNQSAYTLPQAPAVRIDYDQLAMAMVRAQRQIEAENAQVPETTLVTDAPAPATNTENYNERDFPDQP